MGITYNSSAVNAVTFNSNALQKVTYNGNEVWGNAPGYPPYLTFSSAGSFTLDSMAVAIGGTPSWDGTLEYSTDKTNWTVWDGTSISSAADNGTHYLYLRGTGNTIISADASGQAALFVASNGNGIFCNGDIRTLLDYAHPENTTMGTRCFAGLFHSCTNLLTPPALPSTILSDACYASMFYYCTSLIVLPALPALTWTGGCYLQMFRYCSSIKISDTQTGEYQTPYRIPTNGEGTGVAMATGNMFANTGGTFTGAPTVNTTYYTSNTVVS